MNASPTELAASLVKQKDDIDAQLGYQASILSANNATMNSQLVDAEGFPRGDMDIYAVRNARIRIIELRNDRNAVMNSLAAVLQTIYDPANAAPEAPSSSQPDSKPFAKVDGVSPGSPAAEADLRRNDLIIKFGSLTQRSFSSSSLAPLVSVVAENENRPLPLKVVRNEEIVFLSLTPKQWSGKGLLGCHIVPYSPP